MEKEFKSSSPRSVTHQARKFFIANPDECLSYLDMAAKFEITVEQAKNIAHELVRQGFAKVEHITIVKAANEAN